MSPVRSQRDRVSALPLETVPRTRECAPHVGAKEAGRRTARRIGAFQPHLRDAIRATCARSSALEDLAESFPALLIALATGYRPAGATRKARDIVESGGSLRQAAAVLGLPFWLRKLPAQAFDAPLGALPPDAMAARLLSLMPAQTGLVGTWLDRVLTAYHAGGPELALWTAREFRGSAPAAISEGFLRTMAWAWFSTQPGLRGEKLLTERWTPAVGARRAASEAAIWSERISLDITLGRGIADSWLAEGHAHGYDFVALRTADDFIAEARAMDNCLDRYGQRLASGLVRVFSLRRDGQPVGNVEITVHEREGGMPVVSQLRAGHNRRAAMEVWQATYAWLGGQPLRQATPELEIKVGRVERRRRLVRFWKPYLVALPEAARGAFEAAVMPTARASRRSAAIAPPRAARPGASGSPASP